ncbi:hypothetical protein [Phocaeicola coprophilus]|uniref:hypothetical protein n=1 Tax=Phocaeicola coprophilus TaxID=387090 RepID=UPI003AB2FECE
MKISKSLFLAFAGLGLFACSNEDVTTGVDNSGNNSIVIKLDGLTASRSVGDPVNDDNSDNKVATTLNDVAIVLSDGSTIYGVETLKNVAEEGQDKTNWTQLTTSGSGYIIHEVSSHVREVHVIGNYAENAELKSWVETTQTTPTSSNVSQMKAKVVQANTQQDFTKVTLFGEDDALTTVSGGDTAGDPNHDVEEGSTTHTMLQADVKLNHLVSRIEIGNIQCDDLGTMYKQLTLKYIGLLNYYNQIHLDGTTPEVAMTLDNVLEPGTTIIGEDKYCWSDPDISEAKYNDYKWAWDEIATGVVITDKGTPWNPTFNDGTGKFVYQFIPDKIDGKNFNVKLYLDAVENNTSNAVSAFHTVTAKFEGGSAISEEPGKIYKVDFKFGEENIGPWNPSEVICVKVTVSVEDWTIQTVTPTFE